MPEGPQSPIPHKLNLTQSLAHRPKPQQLSPLSDSHHQSFLNSPHRPHPRPGPSPPHPGHLHPPKTCHPEGIRQGCPKDLNHPSSTNSISRNPSPTTQNPNNSRHPLTLTTNHS